MLEAITGVSTHTGIVTTLDGDNIGRGFRRRNVTQAYSGGAFNLGGETTPMTHAQSHEPMALAAREVLPTAESPLRKRGVTVFSRRRTA